MDLANVPRLVKKLTRITDNGRLEAEIEQQYLSKGEADKTFQRIRTFRQQPKVDDLMDGEMGRVDDEEGLSFFVRHGNSLYKLNTTKVV